jgi:hypothetical protein
VFTGCDGGGKYELRRKKRYFNVLKKKIYNKKDLRYIGAAVQGCENRIEISKRLDVLVGIFNVYYIYYTQFDYRVFIKYLEEELKGMSKRSTKVHGRDLYYRVFMCWIKRRDAIECAKKLETSTNTVYWVLGRIRRHLRGSVNKQLQMFGGMFSDLCRLNKLLVPAREKK